MACRRCSRCDINFPNDNTHNRCRRCGEETWRDGEMDYDQDWRDLASVPMPEEARPVGPIPDALCEIVEYGGKKWVAHQNLLNAGYTCLEDFAVVKIAGKFYELQGHIGKTASNLPGGGWWIEEIEWWHAFDDLPTLTPKQYEDLEDRRGLRRL